MQGARLLAKHGITEPPRYPDISNRQTARDIALTLVGGAGGKRLS